MTKSKMPSIYHYIMMAVADNETKSGYATVTSQYFPGPQGDLHVKASQIIWNVQLNTYSYFFSKVLTKKKKSN